MVTSTLDDDVGESAVAYWAERRGLERFFLLGRQRQRRLVDGKDFDNPLPFFEKDIKERRHRVRAAVHGDVRLVFFEAADDMLFGIMFVLVGDQEAFKLRVDDVRDFVAPLLVDVGQHRADETELVLVDDIDHGVLRLGQRWQFVTRKRLQVQLSPHLRGQGAKMSNRLQKGK